MQNPVSTDKLQDLERRMTALGITDDTLVERFVRGSGSGGQKINKTSSCVFLKHLTSGVVVKCQATRSREMNRFHARRELCEELEAVRDGKESARVQEMEKVRRQKRRRSRRSKQRSVADKRLLSGKKALRRPPSAE
ncbi:MAG: peptide chain release factor-like protein [Akkermansiaceae bacterium]|nr:peptide chain release factor-like protein [Akkermansiaceae bacterium]